MPSAVFVAPCYCYHYYQNSIQVRMQLCAEDGTVLKWMIYYTGTSTDPADWFSSDTFHSSSWTDLTSSWSGEYWSIVGE